MITCRLCQKSFEQKRHLRLHIARNHVDKSKWTSKCEQCGKVYADDEILQRHMRNHEKRKTKVKCSVAGCGKSFVRNTFLHKHIVSCHPETLPSDSEELKGDNSITKKRYCCGEPGCNASFTKHHILTQHSFVHTRIPPFPCSQCDRRFLTLNHRNRHEKVHLGYCCETCKDVFSTWTTLVSHMAKEHKKEYECKDCDKVFSTPSKLKQHAIIHTELRPVFQCSQCQRNFTRRHALRKHYSVVHEGLRQYVCHVEGCNKKYAHCGTLKKHIRDCHEIPSTAKHDNQNTSMKKTTASRILGFDTDTISAAVEVFQA